MGHVAELPPVETNSFADYFGALPHEDRVALFWNQLASNGSVPSQTQILRQLERLDSEGSRDMLLSLRARFGPQNLSEILLNGYNINSFIFDRHGLHVIPDLDRTSVLVSAPTWKETLHLIAGRKFKSELVLMPELITVAGEFSMDDAVANLDMARQVTEDNLAKLQEFSRQNPKVTLIAGSPHFTDDAPLPYNAAFHIENGEVIQVSHKRRVGGHEMRFFSSHKDQLAIGAGKSTIMVCKDLPQYASDITRTNMIYPGTEELAVISCWGVGARPKLMDGRAETAEGTNDYYHEVLQKSCSRILNAETGIDRILMVDRTPAFVEHTPRFPTASVPFSIVSYRPQVT